MESREWVSGSHRILVRAPSGAPKLWLDAEGELRDAIGLVRIYSLDTYPASELEIEELAVFVAEWIAGAAERDGAVAMRDINPGFRACVYALAPSGFIISDDDIDTPR